MAKTIAKKTNLKNQPTSGLVKFSISNLISEKYQDILFLILPLILLFLFFSPVLFGGKGFLSGDITASRSMENYLSHAKASGSFPLWTPYLFLGMPSYIVEINLRWFDLILSAIYFIQQILVSITNSKVAGPMFYFYILSISTYYFIRSKKIERLPSFLGATAVTFSTGMIVFLAIGHNTKMLTLCMIPLVLLILEKFREKMSIKYILLLVIALHIQLLSAHIQEIFYSNLMVLIYFIFFFISSILNKKKEEIKNLFKSGLVYIFAGILAAGMSIDQYLAIYEYNPFSIRGTQSIVDDSKTNATTKASGTGLDYDYATNWSFSPGEMLTFIMPSFYGYGASTYKGELTQNEPVDVNTYWGQMPFVDVPQYMGVLVFIFALFAIYFRRKEPIIKFLTILSVFSLLVSFGRTFPIVYDLMFYYFPMFDKFRVPSMILNLVQISFPILAAMGVSHIVNAKENNIKLNTGIINISLIFFGVLFILSLILRGGLESWYIGMISASGKVQKELNEYAYQMFMNDTTVSSLIALLGIGLIYAFLKNKLSKDLLYIILILLVISDLFTISSRGMKMYDKRVLNQSFETPAYVDAIKKDKDVYRILNLKQDGSMGTINQNSNYYSAFLLQDLYGYSAAKPRTYQDLLDVVGPSNETLWRMLNVKYLITDKPVESQNFSTVYTDEKNAVVVNKSALPRAYFVNRYEIKPMKEVLNMIKENKFDPKDVLFFEKGENINIPNINVPSAEAYVNITKYLYENIDLDVNATGNNLLFLGDTYYPKGWNAYIDGKPTEIFRANHACRAIVVPPGKHKVEFKFEPQSFYLGKNISLVLNILVIGSLIVIIVLNRKKKTDPIETTK